MGELLCFSMVFKGWYGGRVHSKLGNVCCPSGSHLSEPCSSRSQQPVSGRVPPKSLPPRKMHNTHSSPMLPNTVQRGGGGELLPIHVMIATLPIAAALGELAGVCHHLNQSHHSRVRPPPIPPSQGELSWWSVWKLPKLA